MIEEWTLEEREKGDKLKCGISIGGLHEYPESCRWVVITNKSFSILGEMVCAVPEKYRAKLIVDTFNAGQKFYNSYKETL